MITEINPNLFPGFRNIRVTGTGSYGTVYRAVHVKKNVQIAIKSINKINLMTKTNRTAYQNELSIYGKIDHPFLAHFYFRLEDVAGVYLAIENASNGTLMEYISNNGKIKEKEASKMFCQLMSAIKYLHKEHNIVHRDIKADNILLDENYDIRLIDFGLAGEMTEGHSMFKERCGSYPYTAPEMLKGPQYSKEIDIWSAGVVLYIMVCGCYPFAAKSVKDLFNLIMFTETQYPPTLSQELRDLLCRMLTKNPVDRITIDQIAEHPWVTMSHSSYFLSTEFERNMKFKIIPRSSNEINMGIINELKNQDIDISNIEKSIIDGEFTEAGVLYHIYSKREMMKKLLSELEGKSTYVTRKRIDNLQLSTGRSIKIGTSHNHISLASKQRRRTISYSVITSHSIQSRTPNPNLLSPVIKKISFS